jgi:hypothetical protein
MMVVATSLASISAILVLLYTRNTPSEKVVHDIPGGKFDKAKSSGRIDALVALAMALSLAPT